MNRRNLLFPAALAVLIVLFSCSGPKAPRPPAQATGPVLPEDCRIAADTLLGPGGARGPVDSAHKVFRALLQKYPYEVDSFAHANLMAWWSQIWYTARNSDSMKYCCDEALVYFETHPECVDERAMCYLYLGWAHYFQNELYTANGFFNRMGNELTDTVFVPGHTPVVSRYNAEVKAALLEEIANIARVSGMKEQARKYILLSLEQGRLISDSMPDIYAFILFEAGILYQDLGLRDSARYFYTEATHVNSKIHDPALDASLRFHSGNLHLQNNQYDSSLVLFHRLLPELQEGPGADSDLLGSLWLSMAEAYSGLRQFDSAAHYFALYKQHHPTDTADDPDLALMYLEPYLRYRLKQGNAAESELAFTLYKTVQQKVFDRQRLIAINDVDAQYNLRRKEAHIGQLRESNEEYANQVRTRGILLTISALVVLLLAAIAVIIWQRQLRRRLLAEKEKVEMEQRLLRSQMEPHFIFNTLSVLQGLIRKDEKNLSILYLNRFARLLRTSLENSRESLVPLSEEVQALEDYLSLQQVRFPGLFDYQVIRYEGYEEEAEELYIPPMLLQPFVENAIRYGLPPDKRGLVTIRVEKTGDLLYCCITDNGPGIAASRNPDHPPKKSLSTLITRERLAILARDSGKNAGLQIGPGENGQGTMVQLTIPLRYHPADE